MDDSSVSEKIIASEKELQNAHALIQSLEKEKNSLNDNLELSKSILEQEKKEKIECMDTLNARIQQYLSILEIKDKELESLRTEIETVRKTHQERMDSNQERIAMLEGLLQGSNIPSLDNADSTLVNIYVSQRDRLKSKCNELEKHLVSKSQAYARLKNENELLQKENIAMFEKIEYLSGFPTHPLCAPSKMDSGCNLNLRSSSNTACDKIEKKYRELYEDKMHTFNEFSRREIHRKWRQLGLINQMSLRISNVLMKKSSFRKIFFAYMFFINSFALFLFIYLCVK
ncbi:Protein CASP [Coelomomyces lativittatus]|nr:Protein CASP [Coelomomyces lativittatus]KAJ1515441.1 Protein CASP [Coelomomyces lativittatus]